MKHAVVSPSTTSNLQLDDLPPNWRLKWHDVSMSVLPPTTDELARSYVAAKRVVAERGFAHEIAWQLGVAQEPLTVSRFVREAAWVVLSAGMSEVVLRGLFDRLASCMCNFDPDRIVLHRAAIRARALTIFRHTGKIDAILEISDRARRLGLEGIQCSFFTHPESFLRSLPYVGPVSWRHLAKNLGMQIAKPDRHLVRIAQSTERPSVDTLCEEIAAWVGDPVSVVDLVLWRWSVLHGNGCSGACSTSRFHRV